MKLSENEKQQIFYDSFDMFKNDWKNNSSTLKSTISEIAAFDTESAIQMWIYLLTHNPSKVENDSEITGGILKALPDDIYDRVSKENTIKDALFKKSSEPWESVALITHFLTAQDFYSANELFEFVCKNKNESEYNYTEYKSSNLATCLYFVLDRMYNYDEDDIDFLSDWIEQVSNQSEKMKLKVILLSKEEKQQTASSSIYTRRQRKNDYLLEGASLEDLELASSKREKFEIKKLVEHICNSTITSIELSKLDIAWLNSVFAYNQEYSESSFNIIGAYYTIADMSWETQRFLERVYKDKVPLESLWKDSYSGDTEYSIKQRLQHISDIIKQFSYRWTFNGLDIFAHRVISTCESYEAYRLEMQRIRDTEMSSYTGVSVKELCLNTRISNILKNNAIIEVPQLVKILDAGDYMEGLGDKSVATIIEKLSNIGIIIESYSVNADLNYIVKRLNIQTNIDTKNDANGLHEAINFLGIAPQNTWYFGRTELIRILEKQCQIARRVMTSYAKNADIYEQMMLMQVDEKTICTPGKYFFKLIDIDSIARY